MHSHIIPGAGGVRLHVSDHGDPTDPAIVFIHGWSQSELCWMEQYKSKELAGLRLVGLDLRGHGRSDKPLETEAYTSNEYWADDLASVMRSLELDRPILVGWSFGGLIIADYLRKYGDKTVRGINLVAAAVPTHGETTEPTIGSGMIDHVPGAQDPDLATNIETMRQFVGGMTVKPLSSDQYETFLAFNMAVPPAVRGAVLKRDSAPDWRIESIEVPVLVSHGDADTVVLPAMSRYAASRIDGAQISWYEDVGHAPFVEAPERFNAELAEFSKAV